MTPADAGERSRCPWCGLWHAPAVGSAVLVGQLCAGCDRYASQLRRRAAALAGLELEGRV